MVRSPLQIPNFRRFWLGQTLLSCAEQFWLIALTWLVLQKTGSGLMLGMVLMAGAIPQVLFTLVGGAISDRYWWHCLCQCADVLSVRNARCFIRLSY